MRDKWLVFDRTCQALSVIVEYSPPPVSTTMISPVGFAQTRGSLAYIEDGGIGMSWKGGKGKLGLSSSHASQFFTSGLSS